MCEEEILRAPKVSWNSVYTEEAQLCFPDGVVITRHGVFFTHTKMDDTEERVMGETPKRGCVSVSQQGRIGCGISHDDFDWAAASEAGRGWAAKVWKVMHRHKGVLVAIKEMPIHERQLRTNLAAEMSVFSISASCPSIRQHFGAYIAPNNSVHLVSEWLDLGDLHAVLKRYKQRGLKPTPAGLPEDVIKWIAFNVLTALKQLHTREFIHRDVKPTNVLFSSDATVKITDFGLSRRILHDELATSVVGTRTYMAPEILSLPLARTRCETLGYSYGADIWAFGVMIAELAIGRHPYAPHDIDYFELTNLLEEGNAIRQALQTHNGLSNDLRSFISTSLNSKPTQRPTATELLNHEYLIFDFPTKKSIQRWVNTQLMAK